VRAPHSLRDFGEDGAAPVPVPPPIRGNKDQISALKRRQPIRARFFPPPFWPITGATGSKPRGQFLPKLATASGTPTWQQRLTSV